MTPPVQARKSLRRGQTPGSGLAYLLAGTSALLATAISRAAFGPGQLADAVMVYLLSIVLVSLRFSYGPSLLAAVLSVLCFDFFFIPPFYTFAIHDLSHVVTFAVMCLVALVISGLTQRVRAQGDAAAKREQRTSALYALSRELTAAKRVQEIAEIAARHLLDALGVHIELLVPTADRAQLRPVPTATREAADDEPDLAVAQWVWDHGRPAGLGTDTFSTSLASYLPLCASRGRVAVLRARPDHSALLQDPEDRDYLTAFSNQIASAIERTELSHEAHSAQLQMQTEQMRSSLLSSVSHDLRTPLSVVTGAASSLLEDAIDAETRRELTVTILEEAQRLELLLRNLLDMTRLEAGAVRVNKEWQPLEEALGAALNRLEDALTGRQILTDLPADLPLVPLDAVLFQQLLVNLLENALKYTPAGTSIEIVVRARPASVEVVVGDHGPGIPSGEEQRIFDKFYRIRGAPAGGVGLGLAICKGIVMAHGGQIFVTNRPTGGAEFHIQLPVDGQPLPPEAPDPLEEI